MKLGELKNLIRHRKGNPVLFVSLVLGADKIGVTVQKSSLLKALDAAFSGGRNTETNLILSDDGALIDEGAPRISGNTPESQATVDSLDDEVDDLDALPELPHPLGVPRGLGASVADDDELDEL